MVSFASMVFFTAIIVHTAQLKITCDLCLLNMILYVCNDGRIQSS